ncbi:MAG: Crp/Fnr family transcriptional regulator [Candidatus Limnocylindrales bacterium]
MTHYTVNKLWFLRRLDLFEGFSETQIEQLAGLMRDRVCSSGEDVTVRPSGDRIYLVKKGRVRVLNRDVGIALLGPGQLFGTSSLFGAATTTQRVVALDDVLICDVATAKFLQIMAAHPGLAAKVMTLMARQLFELEQSVERVATETVDQRLAGLLLSLASRDRGTLRLRNLSQSDLARMIGASRESVSRAIGRWEREGVVAAGQRSVEIRDEAAVQRIAQG